MPTQAKKGEWSDRKHETARALAEGIETQTLIAERLGLQQSTISRWKKDPVFLQKIDDLTLALERHTLAGMLRRVDNEQKETKMGKNDWLKAEEFKSKLLGFDKKKIEHSGSIETNNVTIYIPHNDRD